MLAPAGLALTNLFLPSCVAARPNPLLPLGAESRAPGRPPPARAAAPPPHAAVSCEWALARLGRCQGAWPALHEGIGLTWQAGLGKVDLAGELPALAGLGPPGRGIGGGPVGLDLRNTRTAGSRLRLRGAGLKLEDGGLIGARVAPPECIRSCGQWRWIPAVGTGSGGAGPRAPGPRRSAREVAQRSSKSWETGNIVNSSSCKQQVVG